jgi:hypothetical protein
MLRNRPWIWVVVAHIAIIAVLSTVYIISKKFPLQEVPLVQVHGS